MATIKTEYLLKLDEEDATALKKVLGGMNDDEFARLGVKGDDRRRMSDIWSLLPFKDYACIHRQVERSGTSESE